MFQALGRLQPAQDSPHRKTKSEDARKSKLHRFFEFQERRVDYKSQVNSCNLPILFVAEMNRANFTDSPFYKFASWVSKENEAGFINQCGAPLPPGAHAEIPYLVDQPSALRRLQRKVKTFRYRRILRRRFKIVKRTLRTHGIEVDGQFERNATEITLTYIRYLDFFEQSNPKLIVVQNHWNPIAQAAITAFKNSSETRIAAFHHGITSGPTEFPGSIDEYFLMGPLAKEVFLEGNRRFQWSCDRLEALRTPRFHFTGSTSFDPLGSHESEFSRKTILFLDQDVPNSDSDFGLAFGREVFIEYCERLLAEDNEELQILVRPHPRSESQKHWAQFVKSGFLKIRDSKAPLWKDLDEASIAVGFFSGSIIAAANTKMPVICIRHKRMVKPPEFNLFDEDSVGSANQLSARVQSLTHDESSWDAAAVRALKAATKLGGNVAEFAPRDFAYILPDGC